MAVQFFGLGFNALQDVLRLLTAQHENDAFDRVVILLKAELAEARRMADGYISYVTHPDGHAFVGTDYDVANVICVAYQADAANVVKLSALRVKSATGV